MNREPRSGASPRKRPADSVVFDNRAESNGKEPSTDKDGFAVPTMAPSSAKKLKQASEEGVPSKNAKRTDDAKPEEGNSATSSHFVEGDKSCTVFVSNLDFKLPEKELVFIFFVCCSR